MKIHIARADITRNGGGWSWQSNFIKGARELVCEYDEADIYFITSASMLERSEVEKAKADGKKIVLRVDNILRNSRNRNTGMTRMRDFAEWADLVIYQSVWAKEKLQPFLQAKNHKVILNAVDENIFYPAETEPSIYNVLYSRFNRDETKCFEIARDWFAERYAGVNNMNLTLVGQYSPELVEYNFDFYNNEKHKYLGVISTPENMADVYRNNWGLIYSYYHDACSNTLIEALMCGLTILYPDPFFKEGSANEIEVLYNLYGRNYFMLHRMVSEYKSVMEGL